MTVPTGSKDRQLKGPNTYIHSDCFLYTWFEFYFSESFNDRGSTISSGHDSVKTTVSMNPYKPVTQGAKMYDLVSQAVKADREYMNAEVSECLPIHYKSIRNTMN